MYDHGNLGDIIKHAWLAEVTLLLARRHPAVPFRYADSFCGRPPYPLANAFRPRLESLKGLRYLAIQHELFQNGRYQGSTGLVRAICRAEGIPVELYVSDQNAAALQACLDTIPECRQLRIDPNDGYASLEVESGLDLILLDPFSDFVPKAAKGDLCERIVCSAKKSSILVFVLNWAGHPPAYNDYLEQLKHALQAEDKKATIGRLPPHPRNQTAECKYWFEMLFVPGDHLPEVDREAVFDTLRILTGQLWNLLWPELGFLSY